MSMQLMQLQRRMRIPKDAKAAEFIRQAEWHWPQLRVRNEELTRFISCCTTLPLSNTDKVDEWKRLPAQAFSNESAIFSQEDDPQPVSWEEIVLLKKHVPTFSFILWLHKLFKWQMVDDDKCVLC